MTKAQKIEELTAAVEYERRTSASLRRVIGLQEKRLEAYKTAWRRVHPEDKAFMCKFEKDNTDRGLFGVFNELLYSFGRPDENGRVFTRLDSWNEIKSPNLDQIQKGGKL